MRTFSNNKPLGTDAEANYVQRQFQRQGSELQFYDSTTIKVEQTLRGIRLHARSQSSTISAGWHYANKFEIDTTQSYDKSSVVHIQATDSLVTTGLTDLVAGTTKKAAAGWWVAMQDVPAASIGGYNVPQSPMPMPTNMDDPTNFWMPLGSGNGLCDQQGNYLG
jgi:hypothetical protein